MEITTNACDRIFLPSERAFPLNGIKVDEVNWFADGSSVVITLAFDQKFTSLVLSRKTAYNLLQYLPKQIEESLT